MLNNGLFQGQPMVPQGQPMVPPQGQPTVPQSQPMSQPGNFQGLPPQGQPIVPQGQPMVPPQGMPPQEAPVYVGHPLLDKYIHSFIGAV